MEKQLKETKEKYLSKSIENEELKRDNVGLNEQLSELKDENEILEENNLKLQERIRDYEEVQMREMEKD